MNGENFTTLDILMAAFLMARGHPLLELKPNEAGRAVFVFEDSSRIRDGAKAFLEDAPIPVRTLAKKMAHLKTRTRQLVRNYDRMENHDESEQPAKH